MREKTIGSEGYNLGEKGDESRGFSLVEVLVVISILSALMAILMPVLGKVRRQARMLQCMSNLREIVNAVNYYALDNANNYPESVATITFGTSSWNWQEPTMMTACKPRPMFTHRSVSAYLRSYITEASTLFCPNAPRKYKYLQEAWDAGDDWDNPETSFLADPVFGTYCFYWNYVGYLEEPRGIFRGPYSTFVGPQESELLVSDYFGYDHWRSPNAYGSCEKLRKADITPGTYVSSEYWSCPGGDSEGERAELNIKLHAGYMDGHVESYYPSETVPMKVSIVPDGSVPYPDGIGPGIFYLPLNALD